MKKQKSKILNKKSKKLSWRTGLPVVLAIAVLGSVFIFSSFATTKPVTATSEYISRIYTDALGRIPDQEGWNFWHDRFAKEGCNTAQLKRFVLTVYKSSEYKSINYDMQERLLTLYRGALSREPSAGNFAGRIDQLKKGKSFDAMVDEFVNTDEFSKLATKICTSGQTNYEFIGKPIAIKGTMTQATLQAKLDAAAPGTTVALPRGTVVPVEARLTIPNGVTLTTQGVTGLKGRQAYASMARIYYRPTAAKIDKASLVVVKDGATLKNVWADGQMWNYPSKDGGQTVRVVPSTNSQAVVEFVRSDNPRAAQNMLVNSNTGECNTDVQIRSNLVINNANYQTNERWSDGIASSCANSTITNNEVIDASDVSIIVYRTFGRNVQKSKVTNNKVLQAGNTAFGGLVIDPLSTTSTPREYPSCMTKTIATQANCDFSGVQFSGNTLWTGRDSRFIIGISVGTHAWGFFKPEAATGRGGSFTNNTSGISTMNAQIPVYVSGVYDAVVKDNFVGSKVSIVKGKPGTTGERCRTDKILTAHPSFTANLTNYRSLDNNKCI